MRKFAFPLERVLQWRRLEARVEEGKLERMRGELQAIEAQRSGLQESLTQAGRMVSQAPSSALELASLTAFRRHVAMEQARLEASRADCLRRMEARTTVLIAKRRDVKLIEKLRERKLASWAAEMDRELGQQMEEAHLAAAGLERRRRG